MATSKKTAKSGSSKKSNVKVADMKPVKDAQGGRGARAANNRFTRHALAN